MEMADKSDIIIDNEYFEGFGEVALKPIIASTPNKNDADSLDLPRNDWAHLSLGRSPASSTARQIGTNGLAKHLITTSNWSLNSSQTGEQYGEYLEESIHNLSNKMDDLQRIVTDLAETKSLADNKCARARTAYAVLQTRYEMMEDQFREFEALADKRYAIEKNLHRDIIERAEREIVLLQENNEIKIKAIESETIILRDEVQRLRSLCNRQEKTLKRNEEKLESANEKIADLRQDLCKAQQQKLKYQQQMQASENVMLALSQELERARTEITPEHLMKFAEAVEIKEARQKIEELRQKNKELEELNEEFRGELLLHKIDSLEDVAEEEECENNCLADYIELMFAKITEKCPQLLRLKAAICCWCMK